MKLSNIPRITIFLAAVFLLKETGHCNCIDNAVQGALRNCNCNPLNSSKISNFMHAMILKRVVGTICQWLIGIIDGPAIRNANRGDSRASRFARDSLRRNLKDLFSQRSCDSRELPQTCDSQVLKISAPQRTSQKDGFSSETLNWAAANGGVTNGGLRGVWPPFPEIDRNRPFSPFFWLFRPFPDGAKSTWEIQKTEISSDFLKPPSLKPHLRHSN